MDLPTAFPLRLYCNTATADVQRQCAEAHFYERGMEVRRQPAIAHWWLKSPRRYSGTGERAESLTLRLALRRAMVARAPAVLIFREDVRLHPEWRARMDRLELPEHWQVFHLGAVHEQPPSPAGAGVVRCARAQGFHAVGIRAEIFPKLRRLLGTPDETGAVPSAREILVHLQGEVPVYAAWPNLAWCEGEDFHSDGSQRRDAENVSELAGEMPRLHGPVPTARTAACHPLMHLREVEMITSRLGPDMVMLEYGSGGSTLAFSPLVARYSSIEHQASWHERLSPHAVSQGVQLLLRLPLWSQAGAYDAAQPGQFTDYIAAWRECGPPFDAVLIDGRARVDAALSVAEGMKPGGWLFFHDYFKRERYWRRQPDLERFYELVEAVRDTEQTLAVFRRR